MKIGRYVIGLLSGLTFGFLFAPRKGKELREELIRKGSQSRVEGLKVLGIAFKGAGEDALKEIRGLAEQEDVAAFLEISQEKMRNFLDAAEEKGYDAAAFVQEKLEGLTSMAKARVQGIRGQAEEMRGGVVKKVSKVKPAVKHRRKAKKSK